MEEQYTVEQYTYTGNMPSGNPFLWYYDKNKRTAFETSEGSKYWKKTPEIGDIITYHKSGYINDIDERVYINDELVFERNEEIEKQMQQDSERAEEQVLHEAKKRLGTI